MLAFLYSLAITTGFPHNMQSYRAIAVYLSFILAGHDDPAPISITEFDASRPSGRDGRDFFVACLAANLIGSRRGDRNA
jgi:hypothetical protein